MSRALWPVAFVIPRRVPPSANQLRGKKYRHPNDYQRLRQTWEWEVAAALSAVERALLKAEAEKHCIRVKITIVRRSELDYDNLVGGCKPVVDALKNVGFLKDDSPRWARVEYYQAAKNTTPHTLFSIAPVEEAPAEEAAL
ncbi:MAG: hypothetical protein L0170_18365 [Acidobacteria bacterium]|nr:hypothetical protein [Acidobacteriota bacterium]